MAQPIVNTFTATGSSTACGDGDVLVMIDFGAGSVDLEAKMPQGGWIKAETAITADYVKVWEVPQGVPIRLTCTAYTSPINYALIPKGATKYPDQFLT